MDGDFSPDLTHFASTPGLVFGFQPEWGDELPARVFHGPDEVFGSLNLALEQGGALVRVAENACIEVPVHVVFLGTSSRTDIAFNLRHYIQVEAGASLTLIEHHIAVRRDFAFETTLSGRGYLRLIRRLREAGWRVELLYLALPSAELCRLRVAERVAHGGHAIAPADIIRRFPRSLRNLLDEYAGAADHTRCVLNSGPLPELVFLQSGETRTILNQPVYEQLLREAHP